jgi:glycosyltransferase involved in cell wall biosynthesis
VPLGSRLPIVATLLDLAPWELPETYARSVAARFGHRLRARVLRDAARLIVCSPALAESARRRIHIRPERIAVVPLAVDDAFSASAAAPERIAPLRARLELPERYLVFSGRYDARKDLGTLFSALSGLEAEVQPRGGGWPPIVVLAGPPRRAPAAAAMGRAAERHGVPDLSIYHG